MIKLSQIIQQNFHSVELDPEEFKKIIEDFVKDAYPDDEIVDFIVEDDGVDIELSNGEKIEIEIDWNEFVIK